MIHQTLPSMNRSRAELDPCNFGAGERMVAHASLVLMRVVFEHTASATKIKLVIYDETSHMNQHTPFNPLAKVAVTLSTIDSQN